MFKKIVRTADYLSTDDLEIILTGPFQTGNPLDFSQTKTDEYRKIQEGIRDKMVEVFPLYMWKIPKSGEGQKYKMGAGGTGKAHSPSYYLECIMDCKQIKCNFKKYNFTIKRMQIKFYEFGFATVSIFGMISLKGSRKKNAKVSSSDLLCIVDDLDEKIVNGEVQKIKAPISNITKKFEKTIKENKIKKFFASEKTLDEETNISINNIRSLHRIFEYRVDKNSKIKVAQKALDKIAKLSNGKWQKENGFWHFVGIANSAIVYDRNVSSNCKNIDGKIFNQFKEAYKTVLEAANAYYFIAEFMKNGLFDYSRETVAEKKSKSMWKRFIVFKIFRRLTNRRELDDAQTELNKFIILSSNFLSVLDEFTINLSPQGKSIWDRMNKAWNISKTKEMLQNQLQNSLSIADRVLQQTRNIRQIWLNYIATTFTAIGAISLVEIAGSSGFHWRFHIEKWDSSMSAFWNIGNIISMFTNFFGSFLAIVLSLAIVIAIIVGIDWLICKAKCLLKAFWRKVSNR